MKYIEKVMYEINKIIYSILAIMVLNLLFEIITVKASVAINFWTIAFVWGMGAPGLIILGIIVLLI